MTVGDHKSKTSYLSLALRIMVAFAACWIIYENINLVEVAEKFKSTHILGRVLLAVVVFHFGLCLIGTRWWLFMRVQDIRVPVFLAIKLTFLGQFFTNFMPSAVGGDVIRAWYVSRHTPKRLQAVVGVAVDRLMGLAATFVLAISSYFLFMRGEQLFQIRRSEGGAVSAFINRHPISLYQVVLIVIILIGTAFILTGFFDVKLLFKRIWHHFVHVLKQFKDAVLVYYHHPLVLVFGLGITILLQGLVIISFWLVGRAMGIQAELQFYFVFFPVVWVISSIPVSVAGIGILEGGIVFLFVHFAGADREAVAALALCQRLTWIIASIPGLLVHLSGSHRHSE